MPEYRVNDRAVDQAMDLIDSGDYDTDTDTDTEWSDAAPSTDEANEVIDDRGYDGYGAWHLGIDTSASEETKDRFDFPHGDFSKVNRAALIHAKQRASQNDHDDIVKAADRILSHLDGILGLNNKTSLRSR